MSYIYPALTHHTTTNVIRVGRTVSTALCLLICLSTPLPLFVPLWPDTIFRKHNSAQASRGVRFSFLLCIMINYLPLFAIPAMPKSRSVFSDLVVATLIALLVVAS